MTLLAFQGITQHRFKRYFGQTTHGFCITIMRRQCFDADNELVHRDQFAKNSTHIVPQTPYSPDLAPCDFWLFPKLKRPLRGHRFDTIEEIQVESKKALKAIPEIEFNKCFDDWKKR